LYNHHKPSQTNKPTNQQCTIVSSGWSGRRTSPESCKAGTPKPSGADVELPHHHLPHRAEKEKEKKKKKAPLPLSYKKIKKSSPPASVVLLQNQPRS